MDSVVDPPGAADLVLADAVVHLDPEQAVFEAMLAGWQRQQRTRFLSESGTIGPRVAVVRRMAEFANSYPWQWEPADGEDFITYLRSQKRARPIVVSTARSYEMAIALFVEYVTDRRYGWPAVCEQRFSRVPQRIFHEGNTIAHVADVEGQPGRRPLTYDEVQALFDAADARVGQIRGRGRKGALTALRDAALLKTVYAYGLRHREVHGLDLADRRHSPAAAQYGRYGAWFVRWGKASKGSPPKRRTVLTVPEMDWIVEVLEHWVTEVRPLLRPGPLAAVWVSERAGRMSMRSINEAFVAARQTAGLPTELDLHCLRHSYVTHLIEFDYPERFVSEQVGHRYASTTALYTGVSDGYRRRLIRRALHSRTELWEQRR
ncbi:integrase/recombinase [Rhodococcus ruber BKS 20-38]|uniref:Integrase/recombinase n=1 Tax=Rhodococcus ruber BKS 20-38 TaxID=1278076 RepID=M2X411_9NOCA|nr:tyrosine-type recombinase/integrase [Rhodococcus ruber]EME55761.1 integrase/recombinase [Rhodococcus ruber BKS 20-38]